MNNEIFSVDRLAKLVRRDLRTNYKGWQITVLCIAAVLAVFVFSEADYLQYHNVFTEQEALAREHRGLLTVFYNFFCLISIFAASCFGAGNSTPGMRLNNLMLPASTFEKFLSRWIIAVPLLMAAICLCWEVVDFIRMGVQYVFRDGKVAPPVWFWQILTQKDIEFAGIAAFFAAQATIILGSAIWKKKPVVKTILAVVIINVIYSSVTAIVMKILFFSHKSNVFDTSMFRLLNVDITGTLFGALLIAWGLFCYVMTYMRMGEQEIIERM